MDHECCQHLKITALLLMLMLLGNVSGCKPKEADKVQDKPTSDNKTVQAAEFAPYTEAAVDEQPGLKPYTVASDLGNVENRQRFKFSSPAQARLVQNGFVVLPEPNAEYYPLYEQNRYDDVVWTYDLQAQ